MAENKYITQAQANGNVMIAEEVLVSIIALAMDEVEGVALSGKPGKNWGKGIKIVIDDEDRVEVTCYVNVDYNQSVVVISGNVQEAVANALESMAGVTVTGVNVTVCGIVRQ